MSNWDFTPTENSRVTAGDHRLEILSAEPAIAKTSGNDMIVIVVRPNNSNIKITHRIVKNTHYDKNMTEFKNSFGIDYKDFNFAGWVGAVGAGRLKEDENGFLEVWYFLEPKRAAKLPEWQGEKPERQTVTELGMTPLSDDEDCPFDTDGLPD